MSPGSSRSGLPGGWVFLEGRFEGISAKHEMLFREKGEQAFPVVVMREDSHNWLDECVKGKSGA